MSRSSLAIHVAVAALFLSSSSALRPQAPTAQSMEAQSLREYVGEYEWGHGGFLYLQLWSELARTNQLVAFEESGEVRTLYPTARDTFFAGPGAALPNAVESRVIFRRDGGNTIASLSWIRAEAAPRIARRVRMESRQDASFANGQVRLAGTMISPATRGRHPTIILVHGSGAEDREYVLPLAHFLVRRGIALFGYDKRGVGASSGDWRTATFEDLAGDVAAAFKYLKTRGDVDSTQIGLLGVSQAGWIMPLAAARATGIAFLISISGAGLPPYETTIDETRNELTARGMKPQTVNDIVNLMKLQYDFARTGYGWDAYAAAREKLVTRLGRAPETFPGTPDAPYWNEIRRTYFYDPAPALRELRVPTLAVFGELDDNIVALKNAAAWKSGLQAAGNKDYALVVVPRANHLMLEAKVGNNAEMPSLRRFAPRYSTTVENWLAKHVRTQGAARVPVQQRRH